MKSRRAVKEEAAALSRSLMESSVSQARTDLTIAKKQAAMARRLMLKHNVRLGRPFSRFVCKGCKSLIVPGVNATVRISPGNPPILRTTCSECGRVNRLVLKSAVETPGTRRKTEWESRSKGKTSG